MLQDYAWAAGNGDLDACNGRWTVTPEYPTGIYAYYTTTNSSMYPQYPFVMGCFHGTNVTPNEKGVTVPSSGMASYFAYNSSVTSSSGTTIAGATTIAPVTGGYTITTMAGVTMAGGTTVAGGTMAGGTTVAGGTMAGGTTVAGGTVAGGTMAVGNTTLSGNLTTTGSSAKSSAIMQKFQEGFLIIQLIFYLL